MCVCAHRLMVSDVGLVATIDEHVAGVMEEARAVVVVDGPNRLVVVDEEVAVDAVLEREVGGRDAIGAVEVG